MDERMSVLVRTVHGIALVQEQDKVVDYVTVENTESIEENYLQSRSIPFYTIAADSQSLAQSIVDTPEYRLHKRAGTMLPSQTQLFYHHLLDPIIEKDGQVYTFEKIAMSHNKIYSYDVLYRPV